MKNERSVHSEGSTEEAGFEDNVVPWRSLAGFRGRRLGWSIARPIVLREHEGGKVNFLRELQETLECRGPGIEGRRPRFHVRDVFETTCQRLQQLRLLPRRAQEDARLVHAWPW